jgi:DNA-binding response OmpR family regulator
MLEVLGFRVIQASDSPDALAKFTSFPQAFRLVLLDPAGDGPHDNDLLAQLRRQRADLPVVLLSGACTEEQTGTICLPKPFTLEDLLATLQTVV